MIVFDRLDPSATPAGDYMPFPADLADNERKTLDTILRFDIEGELPWGFTAFHQDDHELAADLGCVDVCDGFDRDALASLCRRGYLVMLADNMTDPIYTLGCWTDTWPVDPETGAEIRYRPYEETDDD